MKSHEESLSHQGTQQCLVTHTISQQEDRNGFHIWKKRKLSYENLASQKEYCLFSFQTFKKMRVSTATACQFLIRLQYSYTFLRQYSTINVYAK